MGRVESRCAPSHGYDPCTLPSSTTHSASPSGVHAASGHAKEDDHKSRLIKLLVFVEGYQYYFDEMPKLSDRHAIMNWMLQNRQEYCMIKSITRRENGGKRTNADAGLWFEIIHESSMTKHIETIQGHNGHAIENFVFESILNNEALLCHALQNKYVLSTLAMENNFMCEVSQISNCGKILSCKSGINKEILQKSDTIAARLTTTT